MLALDPATLQQEVSTFDYNQAWALRKAIIDDLVDVDTRMIQQKYNTWIAMGQLMLAGPDAANIRRENLVRDQDLYDRLCIVRDALDVQNA